LLVEKEVCYMGHPIAVVVAETAELARKGRDKIEIEITDLPVVIDPSHGTGHARLVPDMARAAIAAGCDGLAIEMHPDPQHAMTDGAQSITPQVLAELMRSLTKLAEAVDREVVLTGAGVLM